MLKMKKSQATYLLTFTINLYKEIFKMNLQKIIAEFALNPYEKKNIISARQILSQRYKNL